MASSNTQDLIVDGAELSHPITIKRGKTSRIYQVVAYPTQLTRKITNGFLDGTTTADPKTIKKCRWHTAGIIRFHVNPETNLIYEARPDLHELEITLECLLEEPHKEQLAMRAGEVYAEDFSADNFIICPFQTFMAQLTIRISEVTKTFYGILVDNKELHPMRIIFNIEDRDELLEITSKLNQPRDHDIVLRYDYSLGGTSTARSSLTISAEDVNKVDLEKQIFGKSTAESMVVSRSVMDKIAANITTKLRVVEDIGVGGSSFGQDLIKQEIAKAMSASGFEKFSMDDIKQMQSADRDITDDLKANIINSASSSNANSLESSHHNKDESSSADSSDMLHDKSDSNRRAGGQSTSSSSSWGVTGGIKIPGIADLSGGYNQSNSSSQATNFDNSNSSAKKDHEKVSTESSRSNENSGSNASSNSNSNAVQGEIRQVKNIDAAIVHRSDITKGFTISLSRWSHQLATTTIKGRLTTKTDVEMLEEVQAKENAEREKQTRKEEQEKKAQQKAMHQECELTPQQIDDLLHEIESLDEDKVKEMHAEFMDLCPDGKMTREVFSNAFRNLYSSGKVNNYCRYAFNVFDENNSGGLNFTEYVKAMHAHESDNLDLSLDLAFNVFDYDKSGTIDQKEILHMITSTSELLGKSCELPSAKTLAKKILDFCDKKRNGKITKEEFLKGCTSNKEFCRILIPNFEKITSYDPNYEGDLEHGKKHGKGVYNWPDGRRYEGQWEDDKQQGKGVYTWPDGRRYDGQWEGDKQQGKGVYTCPDGRRYEGDWKDEMKDGNGIETLTDGERYEGEWKNDKKNGKGVQILANGTEFKGDWKDDKKNGNGVYTWPDGRQYEGQWKDDKQGEKGIYIWPDGRRYEGNMKGDMKDGNGIETLADGTRYEGQWKDDKKNGKGVQIYPSGNRYEGDWKDNTRNGNGLLIWSAGNRYEGDWKDDKMTGKGIYIWPSGNKYEGDFKDGNSHGKGVLTETDGDRYEGQWKDDKKNGKGVQSFSNGNRFEGEWQNGERNPNGRLLCPGGRQWNGHINDNLMRTAR